MSNGSNLILNVVTALAEADGIQPEELDYLLHDYVNPETLEKLAHSGSDTWTFTFVASDHQVQITSDGKLFVDGHLHQDNCLATEHDTL